MTLASGAAREHRNVRNMRPRRPSSPRRRPALLSSRPIVVQRHLPFAAGAHVALSPPLPLLFLVLAAATTFTLCSMYISYPYRPSHVLASPSSPLSLLLPPMPPPLPPSSPPLFHSHQHRHHFRRSRRYFAVVHSVRSHLPQCDRCLSRFLLHPAPTTSSSSIDSAALSPSPISSFRHS